MKITKTLLQELGFRRVTTQLTEFWKHPITQTEVEFPTEMTLRSLYDLTFQLGRSVGQREVSQVIKRDLGL